jgi:hypothetical protein
MSDKPEPQRPLPYERSGPAPTLISRGQFRWLLILLTIHLLITVQNTYAPGLRIAVKEWRADRERKAEREAYVKQALAFEQQVMNWKEPSDKVVWEEDPDEAAKLVGGAGYRWIPLHKGSSPDLQSLALPRAALSFAPPVHDQLVLRPGWEGSQFSAGMASVALLHGLRSPSGTERLVIVYVAGEMAVAGATDGGGYGQTRQPPESGEGWTRAVKKYRHLEALPCVPGRGETPPRALSHRATRISLQSDGNPPEAAWVFTPGAGGAPGQVKMEQRNRLRVFAGQPDPADPSRFTIAYDVDGTPGVLTGRLKDDDTIELRPSTGKLVGDRWYPPTTHPLTRPAGGQ